MTRPADGRILVVPGLPNFNDTDEAYKITRFDGWFDTAEPDAQLVPNGSGPGSVAVGNWLPREKAYTLAGRIQRPRAELADWLRQLELAFPTGVEATLTVLGNGLDVDLLAYVRRYQAVTSSITSQLDFAVPLLAADPYRYAATTVGGMLGVFSGSSWLEPFALSGGNWVETFTLSGSTWEAYIQAPSIGPYPQSLSLNSAGTAPSRRISFTVHGPLTVGSWYLLHEGTGRRMWVQAPIAAGQTLTIDGFAWSADLDRQDVTHLLYGQPIGLEPGGNSYRLVSTTANATAYATITARAAYE